MKTSKSKFKKFIHVNYPPFVKKALVKGFSLDKGNTKLYLTLSGAINFGNFQISKS